MKPWFSYNLQAGSDGHLQWKQGPSRPPGREGYSDSPYIDWSAVTLIHSGTDGKPVRENIKLDPAKSKEPPLILPWGTVIELSTKDYAPMKKSIVELFSDWHRTKVTVTVGETRREFTIPVTSGWFISESARDLVARVVGDNPKARAGSMVLQRTIGGKVKTIDIPIPGKATLIDILNSGGWPRIADGDEIIIKERPLNSPASTERILGKNLYFFPDQNVWFFGGKNLMAALKAFPGLLPGHDLSNVKIRIIDINGNERTDEPVDLEKRAAAWDEEASVKEIEFSDINNAGRIIEIPAAPEGKNGPSGKLLRMIQHAPEPVRPQPVSSLPPGANFAPSINSPPVNPSSSTNPPRRRTVLPTQQ
jgi:hypothetical protein